MKTLYLWIGRKLGYIDTPSVREIVSKTIGANEPRFAESVRKNQILINMMEDRQAELIWQESFYA